MPQAFVIDTGSTKRNPPAEGWSTKRSTKNHEMKWYKAECGGMHCDDITTYRSNG